VIQAGWSQTTGDHEEVTILDDTTYIADIGNNQGLPSLNIVKTAVAGQTADTAGELINYTITVANTGNVTLTGVTVTDPFASLGPTRVADAVGDNDALLEVGETWSYTAAHSVTQAEIDSNGGGNGLLENTATADSNETGTDTDDATVPVDQNPAIDITKSGEVPGGTANVGENITYTITVTNTGNTSLTNVVVTDTVEGHSGIVLGTPPAANWYDDPTTPFADVTIIESGGITGDNILQVGETWTYTYLYTIQAIDLTTNSKLHWEDNLDQAVVPPANGARFQAGSDYPATGTGLIQSFVRLQTNTGSEKGYNTDHRPYDTNPSNDAGNVANFNHSILLADVPIVTVGGVDYWEFRLDLNEKNSGNNQTITLTELKLFQTDAGDVSGYNNTLNTFAVGDENLLYNLDANGNQTVNLFDWASGSGHGDYSVLIPVPAVVDPDLQYAVLYSAFGQTSGGFEEWYYVLPDTISNTVSVTTAQGASDSDSTTVGGSTTSAAQFAAIEVQNGADASITKTANVASVDAIGDVIHYTIAVENIGNAGMSGVVVKDSFENGSAITLPNFDTFKYNFDGDVNGNKVLDVGETWTWDYDYTVTRGDIRNNGNGDGVLSNVATFDSVETHPISDVLGIHLGA
jgi:uncharacterized repeat protein (TIGR01451 family)